MPVLIALLFVGVTATSCGSGSSPTPPVSSEFVLISTDSYTVTAGAVHVSGGCVRFQGSLLRVRTKPKPNQPPPLLTHASATFYADRNENGQPEPEEVICQVTSFHPNGVPELDLGLAEFAWRSTQGQLRYQTVVQFQDGSLDRGSGSVSDR